MPPDLTPEGAGSDRWRAADDWPDGASPTGLSPGRRPAGRTVLAPTRFGRSAG